MSDDACPLPSANRNPADAAARLTARLIDARRIAVVGLSDDTTRPAWRIASYLRSIGREVIPVNPKFTELMGLKCFPTVQSIGSPVNLVDVFRRAIFCPAVVEDAIAARAGGVWLQSGIVSPDSRRIAQQAGIDFIENRCLMVEIIHAKSK